MARRTKTELVAEFNRLYSVFETLLACLGPFHDDPKDHAIMMDSVTPRWAMLDALDQKTATASEILAGVQAGLNDLLAQVEYGLKHAPDRAVKILTHYTEKTGRDLFQDVRKPSDLAKQAIKRGQIVTDTEYEVLIECLSQTDQTAITGAEFNRTNDMLAQYQRTKQ